MILYHATRKSLGDKILNEGIIKCNVQREYTSKFSVNLDGKVAKVASTNGYIYLSNSPITAITFANANAVRFNENKICLFELEMDENLLEPDQDQLSIEAVLRNCTFQKNITALECLQECYCASCPSDLELKNHKTRYLVLPSTLYGEDTTREQAEKTYSIIQAATESSDGIGKLEINPNFNSAMEYIQSCNWKYFN